MRYNACMPEERKTKVVPLREVSLFMVYACSQDGSPQSLVAATLDQEVAKVVRNAEPGRRAFQERGLMVGDRVYRLKDEDPVPVSSLKGNEVIRERALSKLTPAERKALGLDP